MNANAAVATKADTTDAFRKVPEVEPSAVTADWVGQKRRWIYVQPLPSDFIMDDLGSVALWRKVQANANKALRTHDAVYLVAFDGTFAIEGVVTGADGLGAEIVLTKKIAIKRSGATESFESEEFFTQWHGDGHEVFRKRDGARVSNERFATITRAKSFIEQQHSKRIG